jgi:hypothetical protein
MKQSFIIFLLLFSIYTVHAQTKAQKKAFKEIAKDISSDVEEIRQNGSLVGYVVFTQLEKISADSFNYKLAIMDENMDDMGIIHFKDQKLYLNQVAFNDNILCLGYLKTNFIGVDFKYTKDCKEAIPKAKTAVYLQFLNLNGKITNTKAFPLEIKHTYYAMTSIGLKARGNGKWKFPVQIKNVSGVGFACFYGDDKINNLAMLNTDGNVLWQKTVKEQDAASFSLFTSQKNAFLLLKKKEKYKEGGYELLGYGATDSSSFPKYVLKDKEGKSLKVLTMENDPATGKLYLAGNIINPRKGNHFRSARQLSHGTYCGVFTININGSTKNDVQASYSYWGDGSQSFISRKGHVREKKGYLILTNAYKDFQGNTIFIGSTFTKKVAVGHIFATILTAPIIFPLPGNIADGFLRTRVNETVLLKQNPKTAISIDYLNGSTSDKFRSGETYDFANNKKVYFSTNFETKTNYIVVDDYTAISIYDGSKKLVRQFPRINRPYAGVFVNIYPAKDGHILVAKTSEWTSWSSYSIEAIY